MILLAELAIYPRDIIILFKRRHDIVFLDE